MIRPAFTEIGIFLIPFAVYALFLVATRSGLLVQSSWPIHIIGRLVLGALVLVVISFILLAHFSGAPPTTRASSPSPFSDPSTRAVGPDLSHGASSSTRALLIFQLRERICHSRYAPGHRSNAALRRKSALAG